MSENHGIPVVDCSKVAITLADDVISPEDMQSCAAEIVDALGGIGFVYLRNHGITKEQIEKTVGLSKQFFSLNQEVKRKYKVKSFNDVKHGFLEIGGEKLDAQFRYEEIRESFNVDYIPGFPFPTEVKGFQEKISDFFADCAKLARRVLILMGVGLKLEDEFYLTKCHGTDMMRTDSDTTLRLLFYPPVVKNADVIRCGEHSDYASITLLFQDDAGGLQVKHRDGTFKEATPIEGCVLINIGDLMQRWTADKLVSTRHRVMVPNSEEKQKQPRYSVAFFVSPDNETLVECLDKSNKYPPIKAKDYLNQRFKETYTGEKA